MKCYSEKIVNQEIFNLNRNTRRMDITFDKELNIEDISKCYICGSPQKRDGCSLHCWDIEYKCGCQVWGALGIDGIYLMNECPNEKNKD